MAQTKLVGLLPLGGAILLLGLAGCATDDNSPSMGAVPPKPNPNMNAQLPPEVREQISHAKPGADANAMHQMKPGGKKQ